MVLRVSVGDFERIQALLGKDAVDVWEGFLHVTLAYINVADGAEPPPHLARLLTEAMQDFRLQQDVIQLDFSPCDAEYHCGKFAVLPVSLVDPQARFRLEALIRNLSGIPGCQISSKLDSLHVTISKYQGAAVRQHVDRLRGLPKTVHRLSLAYVEVWHNRGLYAKALVRRRNGYVFPIRVPRALAAIQLRSRDNFVDYDGDRVL